MSIIINSTKINKRCTFYFFTGFLVGFSPVKNKHDISYAREVLNKMYSIHQLTLEYKNFVAYQFDGGIKEYYPKSLVLFYTHYDDALNNRKNCSS